MSAPAADRVRDRDDELVDDLLAAYDDVRRTAAELPRVVWMRATHGTVGGRLRVPLPTANLDALLRHHLLATVGSLKRRHHALMALEPSDGVRARLDALDHFEQSIDPPPIRRLVVVLVLAVLLVAFVLSDLVFSSEPDARATANVMRAVLTLDRGRVVDTVDSFDPRESIGAAFILALSCCLVLWLPGASCRVKRLLLALDGRRGELEAAAVGDAARTGVYARERYAFGAAGIRPPREWLLDRLLGAFVLVIPLWIAGVAGMLGTLAVLGRTDVVSRRGGYLLDLAAALLLLWTGWRLVALARPRAARGWTLVSTAALVGAAVAAGVAVALPQHHVVVIDARFLSEQVKPNVQLPQYLTSQHLPVTTAQRLFRQNGLVLTFSLRIAAPSGYRLQSRYSVFNATTGRLFSSAIGPAFSARPAQMSGSLDARNLLLFRLDRLTRRVTTKQISVVTRSHVWVPIETAGLFVLRLTLYDASLRKLVSFRTTPFRVAPSSRGFFRTKGRFAAATVRG